MSDFLLFRFGGLAGVRVQFLLVGLMVVLRLGAM